MSSESVCIKAILRQTSIRVYGRRLQESSVYVLVMALQASIEEDFTGLTEKYHGRDVQHIME